MGAEHGSRVLVTGGTGFIGRRLVRALLEDGADVTVADTQEAAGVRSVTGDVGDAVITERTPLRPLTPYGATKAAGEMLLSSYTAAYGIRGAALWFPNVYGPGMERRTA
jgi:nucleoside-diphosphate-sugar epimerase